MLEVGAGTGEIGVELARRAGTYVGMDSSAAMLEVFRRRLGREHRGTLVEGDANARWPVADRSVDIVFGSRVLHLLRADHVASELFRVARGAGVVLLAGRVERDRAGVRARMRRRMRELAGAAGPPRDGRRAIMRLLDECVSRGARLLEPVSVLTWTVEESPRVSLEAWASKSGLAGMDVSDEDKTAILVELTGWATATYGGLDATFTSREEYVLDGVCV